MVQVRGHQLRYTWRRRAAIKSWRKKTERQTDIFSSCSGGCDTSKHFEKLNSETKNVFFSFFSKTNTILPLPIGKNNFLKKDLPTLNYTPGDFFFYCLIQTIKDNNVFLNIIIFMSFFSNPKIFSFFFGPHKFLNR